MLLHGYSYCVALTFVPWRLLSADIALLALSLSSCVGMHVPTCGTGG